MKHKILKWLIGDEFELVPKKQPIPLRIKSKKELIEECLENIDFTDIHEMVLLEWAWMDSRTPPSVEELREAAEERLYSACAIAFDPEYNGEKDEDKITGPFISSCGGFRAEAYLDKTLSYIEAVRLAFELAEWAAQQD